MENKKNTFWMDLGKPFVVLVVICVAAAFLLGITNDVTKPVIEANKLADAEATRKAVLPEAEAFEEMEIPENAGVDSIYRDTNGCGYVVTASRNGYHGLIPVTVGFDSNGKILAVSADVSSETQGVGSRAGSEAFLNRFVGLEGNADKVDVITSATYSSAAVREAVNAAIKAVDEVRKEEQK